MTVSRKKVEEELRKAYKQRGVGAIEQQQLLLAMSLHVQLDIRDLLVDIYNRDADVKIEYVDDEQL